MFILGMLLGVLVTCVCYLIYFKVTETQQALYDYGIRAIEDYANEGE